MMSNEEIDYKLAAEQLRTGKPLFGKDGALAPMLERILNAALDGEMDAHLSEKSRESGNRRNGKMSKKYGEVTVETPRDRDGSFDPQTVRKRETILAEGMADQIIGMYAFGTSTREISRYFAREFDTRLSAETISAITDRVLHEIKEWPRRFRRQRRSIFVAAAVCLRCQAYARRTFPMSLILFRGRHSLKFLQVFPGNALSHSQHSRRSFMSVGKESSSHSRSHLSDTDPCQQSCPAICHKGAFEDF